MSDKINKKTYGKGKLIRGTLQRRLLAITMLCILMILVVVYITGSYIFNRYLKTQILSSSAVSLSNLSESIDSSIEDVYRLVRYCQGSSDIAEYINAGENPDAILSSHIHDRFTEEYQGNEANKYIGRVVVVSGNHFLQVCQTTYSTSRDLAQEIKRLVFFNQMLDYYTYDYSTGIIKDPFISGNNPFYVIPIIRPIIYKYNSDMIGFVYLEISTSLISDRISKYDREGNGSFYLMMGDKYYQYINHEMVAAENIEQNYKLLSEYTINERIVVKEVEHEGKRHIHLMQPLAMEGCYLVQELPEAILSEDRSAFILLFVGILLSILVTGVVLSVFMEQKIYMPMGKIHDKIDKTAAGDFSRDSSIEWDNELGDIGKGINDLSESVNQLLESRLKDEKDRRRLEYKMLQSQINPHFLYNSLNSIKMMASIQGATGIVDMTTALSSLLRSISKGTKQVIHISEELSLVKDYFTIQNYRYGGMLGFDIIVDDEKLLNQKIVKFTLQPLVENAIFHGLEPKGGMGNVTIHVYPADDVRFYIDVTDDGVGIEPEKAAKLLTESTEDSKDLFEEIGISNVNRRLQYEFGEKYGISIQSEVGRYTTMQVVLPMDNSGLLKDN